MKDRTFKDQRTKEANLNAGDLLAGLKAILEPNMVRNASFFLLYKCDFKRFIQEKATPTVSNVNILPYQASNNDTDLNGADSKEVSPASMLNTVKTRRGTMFELPSRYTRFEDIYDLPLHKKPLSCVM